MKTFGLTLLASLLLAAPAVGQAAPSAAPAPRPSRIDKKAAKRFNRQARTLYQQGRFAAAARALVEAYRQWPRRELLFNIALCYQKAGDKVGVATHLRRYLRRASAAEKRAVPVELRTILAAVGVLVVRTANPRATIWVDGRLRSRGALEQVVLPGQRAVEIKLGRQTLVHRIIDVGRGETKVWEVVVARRPSRRLGRRPRALPVIPPKPRPMPRRLRLHWGYFVAVAGLAVATAAVGTGLGLKTKAVYDAFDARPTEPLRRDGVRYQTAANVMWALTAAAAAGAAVLALFTRWKRRERPVTLSIGPGGATLHARW